MGSMGFNQISSVLDIVVDNWSKATNLQANVNRLHELVAACDRLNYDNKADSADMQAVYTEPRENGRIKYADIQPDLALAIDNVMLVPPGSLTPSIRIGGASLKCANGHGVLLMGPSGVGKTSLLRAVAGLWKNGIGTIARPGGGEKEKMM